MEKLPNLRRSKAEWGRDDLEKDRPQKKQLVFLDTMGFGFLGLNYTFGLTMTLFF